MKIVEKITIYLVKQDKYHHLSTGIEHSKKMYQMSATKKISPRYVYSLKHFCHMPVEECHVCIIQLSSTRCWIGFCQIWEYHLMVAWQKMVSRI